MLIQAVAAMRAGLGATVELPVGNKRPIDAIGRRRAVTLRGVVRALTNVRYVITGPTYTGQTACMGPSAVLDLGGAAGADQPHARALGPGRVRKPGPGPARRFSRACMCRPVFVPISSALVECDSPGVTSSDYGLFAYQRRQRPLYPLEPMAQQDYRAQANAGRYPVQWRLAGAASAAPDHTGRRAMATVRLLSDEEVRAIPEAWAVFEDIRATRKSISSTTSGAPGQ